jgi:hypothetical protein
VQAGGVVLGFTGDGIMAIFGAAVAFKDAPLRACHVALFILRGIKGAGDELEQVRIGPNAGLAAIGEPQGTPTLASRERRGAVASVCRTEFDVRERDDPLLDPRNSRDALCWRAPD